MYYRTVTTSSCPHLISRLPGIRNTDMALNPNTAATVYQAFINHAPAVQQALVGGAQDLFAGLALIELVIVVGWLFLQKTDLIDILAVVLRLTIGFGFWLFMLQN